MALSLIALAAGLVWAGELPPGVHALDGLGMALPHDDLEPFGALVGDADFVALGESVHTSGGYYDAKARLFRYLVEERGFRVLAMETPWIEAEHAARYVATCEGSAESATTAVFGVFQDVATARLLRFMCDWNRAHPDDPVHFSGFDVQQPWDDMPRLRARLEAASAGPAAQDALADVRACAGATAVAPSEWYELPDRRQRRSRQVHERCLRGLDAVEALLAGVDGEEAAWARVHAIGLRAWEGEVWHGMRDREDLSYEARDEGMAEVLLRLRELRFPDQKVVVWAHNSHVAARNEQARTAFGSWRSMGSFLHERLGEDWLAVGLVGWDVDIDWADFPDPPLPEADTAVESTLRAFGAPWLLVDLRTAALFPPDQARTYGSIRGVPADQFRALLYLERSRPLYSLQWMDLPLDNLEVLRAEQGSWALLYREPPELASAERLVGAFAAKLDSHGWAVTRNERGEAIAMTFAKDGREAEVRAWWDADAEAWAVRVHWASIPQVRSSRDLAAYTGRLALVSGVLREQGAALELRDGTVLSVAGAPSGWSQLEDRPIRVDCRVWAEGRLTECGPPTL